MFQNYTQNRGVFSFFEVFDIFGIPITIRYNQKEKHKTQFGALISLLIIGLLLSQLYDVVFDIINYRTYSIIFQENIVEVPKRYDIGPKNFTFAFGLQNTQLKLILDERIYYIEGQYQNTYKQFNNVTNQQEYVTETKLFKPEICTPQHFQVEGAIEYFNSLPYKSLYCLPLGLDLVLEGQFGSAAYKRFRLIVKYCKGDNCLPLPDVQKTLEYCNLQIYYVNKVIQFDNRLNPFKSFGQNIFWQSGFSIMKNINVYFRNSYLESDEGILSSQTNFEREQLVNQVDQKMFDVFVNLEKNKESQYNRKYLKLIQGLSQLGGLYNFLFSLGCILCFPISRLILKQKLLNSVFSFKDKETKSNGLALQTMILHENQGNVFSENDILQKQVTEHKVNENIQENKSPVNFYSTNFKNTRHKSKSHILENDMSSSIEQNNYINKNQSLKQNNNNNNDFKKRISMSINHNKINNTYRNRNKSSIYQQQDSPKEHDNYLDKIIKEVELSNFHNQQADNKSTKRNRLISKIQNQLNPTTFVTKISNMKIKIKDILNSLINSNLNCIPCFKPSAHLKMIDYSIKKLNNHLDMSQIITKLQEIEKLKLLLLNDEQIKLFEFIPQPEIDEDNFSTQNQQQNEQIHSVFQEDERTLDQKAIDAQAAFNKIFNNNIENISDTDKKLLTLLDPNVQAIFSQPIQNNSFVFHNLSNRNKTPSVPDTLYHPFRSKSQTRNTQSFLPKQQFFLKKELNQDLQEEVFGHKANTVCDKDNEQLPYQ